MPRLVATDYIDLDAYVSNKLGYSQAILKNAPDGGWLSAPGGHLGRSRR